MKFCQKCGVPNPDTANYCGACKTVLEQSQEQVSNKERARLAMLNAYKSIGSSGIMLALVVCYVLMLIASIPLIFNVDDMASMFREIARESIGSVPRGDSVFMIIAFTIGVIELLHTALMLTGYAMLYNDSLKATDSIYTRGLNYIKGIATLGLVCSYLFAALGVLTIFISIIDFIIVEIVILPVILYFRKLISTLDSIQYSASTLTPSLEVSTYVIVINYVIAALAFISLPYNLTILSLISTVIFILNAVLFSVIKRKIESVQLGLSYAMREKITASTYSVVDANSIPDAKPSVSPTIKKPITIKMAHEIDMDSEESGDANTAQKDDANQNLEKEQ